MLPTPSTSHVPFDRIYEPAEDSFLLLDTLSNKEEKAWLSSRYAKYTPLALEVGTGSGVVVAFLTANSDTIIGRPVLSMGIDVNIEACNATKVTALQAITDQRSKSMYAASVNADICSAIRPGSVDILVFNPPYVPTEDLPVPPHMYTARDKFDRDSHLLSLSYAGGIDGMEITIRLLEQIPTVLSEIGVAYILLCRGNKPEEVKTSIKGWPDGPWNAETVATSGKTAGWEKLEIIRIWKGP